MQPFLDTITSFPTVPLTVMLGVVVGYWIFALISGATFDARWPGSGLTVDDLLYIVQTQMPWGDPGRLTRNQYLDIVAHLLAANGYPGGPAGLPTDAASLAGRRLAR